jgi:hypothetical protein
MSKSRFKLGKPRFWRLFLVGIVPANFSAFVVYGGMIACIVGIDPLWRAVPWLAQSPVSWLPDLVSVCLIVGVWAYAIAHSDPLRV